MTENLQSLIAQRAELDVRIAAEKDALLDAAVQAAMEIFDGADIALDKGAASLLAQHNQRVRSKRTAGTKVAPKYRHKLTGVTWSGRGKQPKWHATAALSDIEHLGGATA